MVVGEQYRPDRVMPVFLWSGTAMATLWLAMSFTYPFGWDQGLFAWMGNAIVHGGLPYRDAWDIKGPLLYYAYALAQWVFGVHLWSIRALDAMFLAAAAAAVFRTTLALTGAQTARFATVFYVLWYASHSYWHTAQPDGWAGMLTVIATGSLLSRSSPVHARHVMLAGICLGLAALLKPIWTVLLALPLVYLATSQPSHWIRLTLVMLGGWLVPVASTLAWFAWQGALGELMAVHFGYSSLYVQLATDNPVRGLAEYFLSSRVAAVSLPLWGYGLAVLWKARRPAALMLGAWLAVTVLLVALQGRFYAYHWLPLLPAATILIAVALHDLSLTTRAFARIVAAVLLLGCAAPITLEAGRFVAWRTGLMDDHSYYDAYGEPGPDMRAIEWLQTRGAPGKIFTFGWHCTIPWLSQRETVSRFGYSLPLMMGEGSDFQSRYRRELLAALAADRPRYIVVGSLSEQILGRRLTIADFPELAAVVEQHYRPVAHFGAITIHEIKS